MNGAVVTQFMYCDNSDNACQTVSGVGTGLDVMTAVMGGVVLTRTGATQTWSHPNIHGDIAAQTNSVGVKVGSTSIYDPYGQPITTSPSQLTGNLDYAWLGQHQRPTEHEATLNTIEMGARQYVPGLGRFIEVDPVEGGSSNDYDYVGGDPMNASDLDGRLCNWCKRTARRVLRVGNYPGYQVMNAAGWVYAGGVGGDRGRGCGDGVRCHDNARNVPSGADANTLGRHVFCRRRCGGSLLEHEKVHVRQTRDGGLNFVMAYVAESAVHGVLCRNRFERPAYAKNRQCRKR